MAEKVSVTTVDKDGIEFTHSWDPNNPALATVWVTQKEQPKPPLSLDELIKAYRETHDQKITYSPGGKMELKKDGIYAIKMMDSATQALPDVEYVLSLEASDPSVICVIGEDGKTAEIIPTKELPSATATIRAKLKGETRARIETTKAFSVMGAKQAVDAVSQMPIVDENGAAVMEGDMEAVIS